MPNIKALPIDIYIGKPPRDGYIIAVELRTRLRMSKKLDLDAMSIDEMWQLHEETSRVLSVRLTSEKRELETRLAQLRRENGMPESKSADRKLNDAPRERRKYPRVYPKYRNPNEPSETWSGRGKQPRWLTAALKTGHTIEEFAISNVESKKIKPRRQGAQVG
jgi:DNA-binding protein H-NS